MSRQPPDAAQEREIARLTAESPWVRYPAGRRLLLGIVCAVIASLPAVGLAIAVAQRGGISRLGGALMVGLFVAILLLVFVPYVVNPSAAIRWYVLHTMPREDEWESKYWMG